MYGYLRAKSIQFPDVPERAWAAIGRAVDEKVENEGYFGDAAEEYMRDMVMGVLKELS